MSAPGNESGGSRVQAIKVLMESSGSAVAYGLGLRRGSRPARETGAVFGEAQRRIWGRVMVLAQLIYRAKPEFGTHLTRQATAPPLNAARTLD